MAHQGEININIQILADEAKKSATLKISDPEKGFSCEIPTQAGQGQVTEETIQSLVGYIQNPALAEKEDRQLRSLYKIRCGIALSKVYKNFESMFNWLLTSRELSNFTYDLTEQNVRHLSHVVSIVTGKSEKEIASYIREPYEDTQLKETLYQAIAQNSEMLDLDRRPFFGRRLGWYATVRALRPKVVVEAGIDKGLGSLLLAAAIARNAQEGHGGRYYGIDINPKAGYLFSGDYCRYGEIKVGDSISVLSEFDEPIDLFISDSDHRAGYETREYEAVIRKLSEASIVIADNAHVTNALMDFAEQTGRRFVFFKEEPKEHWYPGAGIGFAWKA